MNMFTAIFFEEHRIASIYEDTIAKKYRHLNQKNNAMWKNWFKGLVFCCKKNQTNKEEDEDAPPDLSAVNDFKEKMRLQREARKKKKK